MFPRHCLLCLPLLALSASMPAAGEDGGILPPPVTRWVGAGGGCDFATIQAAINASAENDIVRVASDQNYLNQTLTITNRSLTLAGGYAQCGDAAPSTPSTLVRGNGANSVLRVAAAGTARNVLILRIALWDGGPDIDGGGGIDLSGLITLTLDGVSVLRNDSNRGGGIRIVGAGVGSTLLRLHGGTRIGSTQAGFGNSASIEGGGIHCQAASIQLRNGAISGNASSGSGGGLYLDGCNLSMTDLAEDVSVPTAIDENTATVWGGGLYALNGSTIQLRSTAQQRTRITDNVADNGGGGVSLSGAGTLMLADGVRITGNSTDQFGGGVRVTDGAVFDMDRGANAGTHCPPPNDVHCSVLSDNSALAGGAVVAFGGAEADIRQTWIEGNTGTTEPIARIFDAELIFSDNLVRGNEGGGFSLHFSQGATGSIGWSTLVDGGTFTLIRASGGSQVDLVGSIVWQESGLVGSVGDGGSINGYCLNLFEDSLLSGSTDDPLFVDPDHPSQPDFRLRPESPGADACDTAFGAPLSRDVAGRVRPYDLPGLPNGLGAYDMGAFEIGDLIFADGFGTNQF